MAIARVIKRLLGGKHSLQSALHARIVFHYQNRPKFMGNRRSHCFAGSVQFIDHRTNSPESQSIHPGPFTNDNPLAVINQIGPEPNGFASANPCSGELKLSKSAIRAQSKFL